MTDVAEATTGDPVDPDAEQRELLLARIADRRDDLEDLRSFLTDHPELPTPGWTGGERFLIYVSEFEHGGVVDAMARFARVLAPCEKSDDGGYFNLIKRFGELELHVYTSREQVCERVVAGVEEVEEDVVEVTGRRTVRRELVEWKCRSLLSAAERSAGLAGVDDAREALS